MIQYSFRYWILPTQVKWFATQQSLLDKLLPSIYYRTHFQENSNFFGIEKISHTLEINLQPSEEELKAAMIKSNRQQVRQAEESGIEWRIITDREIFRLFYNEFALSKKINPIKKDRLEEMGEYLIITGAYLHGTLLAAHSYILDKDLKKVRIYHSATKRLEEGVDKNIIGKANKFLHFKDILYFKISGCLVYDFGGYALNTSNPELLGINNFKESFGGQVVESINYSSYSYYFLQKVFQFFSKKGTESPDV